jgi:DsbC/DsbD-like thiol-disulfide interchange protein
MTIMSRLLSIAAMAPLVVMAHGAKSEPASAWVEGFHSRARLVAGGYHQGRLLAGIEITLDPGFKTYWRDPGESGLPPRFEWSGSANAARVELQWPAPERSEDAGGVANGYHDRVIFPILSGPKDPTRPVSLAVQIDYGVCKDICIPAHAELALDLSGQGDRPALQPWLDRVPRRRDLGDPAALSVLAVAPVAGDKPAFAVEVRAPEGSSPTLFAEGPDNWYLSTSSAEKDGRFLVTIEEKPKDAAGEIPIRFTLVAGDQAIETIAPVNASR